MVSENVPTAGARGAPKHGSALLSGLLRCCRCGRKLTSSTLGPRVRSPVMHAFAGDSIMESLVASHWAGCVSTADRAGRVELDGVEIEDGKLYIARTPPAPGGRTREPLSTPSVAEGRGPEGPRLQGFATQSHAIISIGGCANAHSARVSLNIRNNSRRI